MPRLLCVPRLGGNALWAGFTGCDRDRLGRERLDAVSQDVKHKRLERKAAWAPVMRSFAGTLGALGPEPSWPAATQGASGCLPCTGSRRAGRD